jgi:KUP system potassium uptake protein
LKTIYAKYCKKAALPATALAALGVVFGDIGTSPLYALKESFHAAHGLGIQPENVLGILSIIFWCLMLIISIKYIAIVMRADNNGEGGIMALLALNLRKAKISDSKKIYLIAIGFVGASLFFGDGIITPAISVLSAVEGLSIATNVLDPFIVPIAIVIVTTLFLMQKHGTAFVGKFFGPITLLWFLSLGILVSLASCKHQSYSVWLVLIGQFSLFSLILYKHFLLWVLLF